MALYSLQIERHVLGGLINHPEVFSEIERFVHENDFVEEPHNVIFSCIKSSILNNEKIDKILLSQKIKNLGISFKADINIFDYVDSISFAPITSDATIKAAQELVKLRILRTLDGTCDKIKDYVKQSLNQDLQKTIANIDKIYGDQINTFEFEDEPDDIFSDMYEMVEEIGNNPVNEIGLETPFPEFNRMYGGLRGGNMYAIASRPKQGKTTWLNHMGIEAGKLNKVPVLMLDTEMPSKEIKFRIAANKSTVPLWYLETGNWRKNPEMVEKVRLHLAGVKNDNKVYHYYVGNKTVDEVCSIIRRWILKVVGRGKKCIVIYDYLKLTGEKLGQNWAEHQALGEKVNKFKGLSVEFDFPFLTAIQLNRSGENLGKQSDEVTDDGSAIAQSDRLMWFCTWLAIFRRKTEDEIVLDTEESGTHKMIEIAARFQGRDAAGHQDWIRRRMPDGKVKYVRNYINYDVINFNVRERGSLRDSINRQNDSFLITDNIMDTNEETL